MGVSVGLGFRAVYVADARRKRRALTGTLFRFDVVQARAIGVSAARVNPRRSRRGWAQGCMCERSECSHPPAPPLTILPLLIARHVEIPHSSTTRFGLGGLLYYG